METKWKAGGGGIRFRPGNTKQPTKPKKAAEVEVCCASPGRPDGNEGEVTEVVCQSVCIFIFNFRQGKGGIGIKRWPKCEFDGGVGEADSKKGLHPLSFPHFSPLPLLQLIPQLLNRRRRRRPQRRGGSTLLYVPRQPCRPPHGSPQPPSSLLSSPPLLPNNLALFRSLAKLLSLP